LLNDSFAFFSKKHFTKLIRSKDISHAYYALRVSLDRMHLSKLGIKIMQQEVRKNGFISNLEISKDYFFEPKQITCCSAG